MWPVKQIFSLKVVVPTKECYEAWLLNGLTPRPEVSKIRTIFVMSTLKDTGELPLEFYKEHSRIKE